LHFHYFRGETTSIDLAVIAVNALKKKKEKAIQVTALLFKVLLLLLLPLIIIEFWTTVLVFFGLAKYVLRAEREG
jgi:hypothetical protein